MGYDLVEDLIGEINLGDMSFLEITGRLPTAPESKMFNAMLVTSVEHGIVPSTLATRLTWAGAPESLQGAVAAGLLGLGTVFNGTTEGTAKMLIKALPDAKTAGDIAGAGGPGRRGVSRDQAVGAGDRPSDSQAG